MEKQRSTADDAIHFNTFCTGQTDSNLVGTNMPDVIIIPNQLEPGDIFLTRGTGFISSAIRFFSRTGGESRTEVNHAGLVCSYGTNQSAYIVEANRVVQKNIMGRYRNNKNTDIAIFRPVDRDEYILETIALKAESYVGRKYGYLKIVAHFLDWCLGGRYLFRRFARMDRYPICSWVVSYSYDAVNKTFGVPPWAASPDDIWDYCISHPNEFVLIHKLGTLP